MGFNALARQRRVFAPKVLCPDFGQAKGAGKRLNQIGVKFWEVGRDGGFLSGWIK
jgi:hypothetical protein